MKTNKILLSGIAAGFALMSTQAVAGGSIGGDCCADLEERVAELEATTVRKGNRKVSLKLSGHVNKALVFGDDPFGNVIGGYDPAIEDNNNSPSRFRLTGKAKISSDLYAGYAIEFGLGSGVEADNGANGIFRELRKNELYIGSKTLGKLSIGKGDTASNGISEIDLSGTNYLAGGTLEVFDDLSNLDGFSRKERVRYDSPSLAGFKLSASWQENDDTDIALRFAGALGDFKLAAGVAVFSDDSADTDAVSGSASALHVPTGINVTFAAGDNDAGREFWFVQGGIKQKVFAAGATAIAVGYFDEDNNGVDESRLSIGLVQKIDAAAMELYAKYNHYDEADGDVAYVGARIKF